MITSAQLKAARALLGIDQKKLAEMAGISVPTIQRMEASQGIVRGVVNSLNRVVEALRGAGVELIDERSPSAATGHGVRLFTDRPETGAPHPATGGRQDVD